MTCFVFKIFYNVDYVQTIINKLEDVNYEKKFIMNFYGAIFENIFYL